MDKEFRRSLLLVCLIPVLSCCVTFGICKEQINTNTRDIAVLSEKHDKDIAEMRTQIDQSNVILQSINNNLAELNTKVNLLIEGKINTKKE